MNAYTDEELDRLDEVGRRRTVEALFTLEQTSFRDFATEGDA